ncbi:MAG: methyltransferase domain-containing protein [Chitinophagaceae bacterium]|nr:methyltransferase domain-containing protein [Chitinophagaceae bacterium]
MRSILLLITLFLASCSGTKLLNERFNYEISNYNLENIDTLVDIGCGFAHGARFISSKFQNLHFILEDLPKDIWGNDMKVILTKNVRNTPAAPTFGTNSMIVFGTPDSIPLQSGRYERVLCRITLHEFSNREKMISELIRILSPTGTLLIVERTSSYEGQRDKYCKQLYLTKDEIIKSFGILKLVDTIQLQPLADNGFLFKFTK